MFRIGIAELGLVCLTGLLILIIPLMISRYSKSINKRLKDIEDKIDKE